MGNSKEAQTDKNLAYLFKENCIGKSVCSMYLQYDQVFSSDCRYEIDRRLRGYSNYGPSKVYAIAQCESDTIKVGQINYAFPWKYVSIGIVCFDCIIVFMFTVCIMKLRFREEDTVQDMKQEKVRLEDFSVDIPNIPISQEDYDNNPDLLTAMLACHLEEIVGHELQQIPELTTIQKYENHVLEVNYGYTNHTAL